MFAKLGFLRKQHIPFLVTGHPRCGTTSAAEACAQISVDLRSEEVGHHGISSWMMAVNDWQNPFGNDLLSRSRYRISWDQLVLVVRNPQQAVPSVMVENSHSMASYTFRRKHIKKALGIDLDEARDPVHSALMSILCWTEIILRQKPDFSFRIEDEQPKFLGYLAAALKISNARTASEAVPVWVNTGKVYDGIRYAKPSVPDDAWKTLDSNVQGQLRTYCRRFGYPEP